MAVLSGKERTASLEKASLPSTTTSKDEVRPTAVVGAHAKDDAPSEASARREISAARARALGAYPHIPLRPKSQGTSVASERMPRTRLRQSQHRPPGAASPVLNSDADTLDG